MTCVTAGGGYLWLGDADGFMHCLDSTLYLSAFRAYTGGRVRLCRHVPSPDNNLLLTVGTAKPEGAIEEEEVLCVWNTKKWSLTSKTSFPVCCRSVKTAVANGRALGEVTCLDVSPTLDAILLGHSGGAVQLVRGDITSDR